MDVKKKIQKWIFIIIFIRSRGRTKVGVVAVTTPHPPALAVVKKLLMCYKN